MSKRVDLPVAMTLCSDAIFGSGYSIPGGEDLAVCRDARGYPYLNGATWKGLLRESLNDLCAWGAASKEDTDALLGVDGWLGQADGRRVRLTQLSLEAPPEDPEDCFALRTFTKLKGGVVKTGSLRTAACILAGLTFSGHVECDQDDLPLIRKALAGIKWAGTHRSRGFGQVRFSCLEPRVIETGVPAEAGTCLRLRLRTCLPVILTDPNRSDGNFGKTYGFIPGSAVRGAVIEAVSAQDPAWFEAHKTALLGDGVRFLDAFPIRDPARPPLPSIRGFYEDKEETRLESVVINGEFETGLKRARLGTFCAPDGETLRYWSASAGGATRIQRETEGKQQEIFQVQALDAGQEFEGCILLEDPALGPVLTQALGRTVWLGADRYAGYGKCEITLLDPVLRPAWQDAYGFGDGEAPGEELYLLAFSPLTMLDAFGEPCGLDELQLGEKLGVKEVQILYCATAMFQSGGYNRAWQCRAPSARFYDRGSLFHLKCRPAPTLEALRRVEAEGLGIRRAEGFGQVVFLPPARIEGLKTKQGPEQKAGTARSLSPQAQLRRARYIWVMAHTDGLRDCGLSKSQVGTIQTLCQKAIAQGGVLTELEDHLAHNLENRGALHGARYKKAVALIRAVLNEPLEKTLELKNCPDSIPARLELLCLLFDHSRKGEGDA